MHSKNNNNHFFTFGAFPRTPFARRPVAQQVSSPTLWEPPRPSHALQVSFSTAWRSRSRPPPSSSSRKPCPSSPAPYLRAARGGTRVHGGHRRKATRRRGHPWRHEKAAREAGAWRSGGGGGEAKAPSARVCGGGDIGDGRNGRVATVGRGQRGACGGVHRVVRRRRRAVGRR